jgi:hypothetical protein
MTDNERLGKIWEFVKTRLSEVEAEIEANGSDYEYSDYDWGTREAFNEVLDFMDDLTD